MRKPHYRKPHTSAEFPQQCIWFDTETSQRLSDGTDIPLDNWKNYVPDPNAETCDNKEVTHHLTFGYGCYMRYHRDNKWSDEDWLRFTTLTAFWDWVHSKARPKTKLYLFCHNTAFDLPVLNVFNELPRRGWCLRRAIIDAPPTILQFTFDGCTIVILDTLNIWRMALEKLGKKIGLPKLEMPSSTAPAHEWERYGKRDVEILRAAVLDWFAYLKENDMGGFAPTLASQAMVLFRHKYMRHRIFIDTNEKALQLTRAGYYGGRVECFYIGHFRDSFYALDFNAMYPAVMQANNFPIKLIGHTHYASTADLTAWFRTNSLTARVLINTPEPFAPLRTKDKLIFPVGQFECILSTPELQYALERNYIIRVSEVAVYEHAPIYHDMMNDMQEIKSQARRDGDEVTEFRTKILQNSLYGKEGQSGIKWNENDWIEDLSCRQWIELDMETGLQIQHRTLAGLHQVKVTEGESRESFPAIAAHVTAYARMKLWQTILQAGRENVYYCDTDCVVVNQSGYDRLTSLIDEYALGMLKLEGEYDDIVIHGNKDYCFNEKVKTKGVRNNAVWLDGWTISQEQWSGLRGLVRDGDVTAPRTRKIIKRLSRLYSKGLVQADGVVLPHRLDLATIEQAGQLVLDPDSPYAAQ
jgi:hypothetical protein